MYGGWLLLVVVVVSSLVAYRFVLYQQFEQKESHYEVFSKAISNRRFEDITAMAEEYCLTGYNGVYFLDIPTFRRNISLPSLLS
jgi:hypothetical protein